MGADSMDRAREELPLAFVCDMLLRATISQHDYDRGYEAGRRDALADRPSFSLSQIDWLLSVIEIARSRVETLFDEHATEAALSSLRTELTKETR